MAWRIRFGGEDDATAVSTLAEQTFRDAFGAMNSPGDMDLYCSRTYSPDMQRDELLDPNRTTLLVEDEDQLIGYAQLRRQENSSEGRVIEIDRFYVVPGWHGAGVAQEMMRRVIGCSRDSGAVLLRLGVWEKNARAIRFYRNSGFVECGDQIFLLGNDPQRDLVFQLALDR